MHMFFIFVPALLFALLKVDRASGILAGIFLAEALLKPLLGLVALQVNVEESMIVMFALIVELDPHSVGRCVRLNLTLQPSSKLASAVSSVGLAVTS